MIVDEKLWTKAHITQESQDQKLAVWKDRRRGPRHTHTHTPLLLTPGPSLPEPGLHLLAIPMIMQK